MFGGKDTLLYASLCIGAVGGVCTAGNFMPELIVDIYNKYVAGDIQGSLAAQYKLNPVRLDYGRSQLPGSSKGYGNHAWTGSWKTIFTKSSNNRKVRSYDKMKKEMEKAGLI